MQHNHNVVSRKHLYELLVRNGFFLPKLKSALCNYDYLCAVKSGLVTCPKYENI